MTQEIADNPKHSHKDELFPVYQKIVRDNIHEDKQHSNDQ